MWNSRTLCFIAVAGSPGDLTPRRTRVYQGWGPNSPDWPSFAFSWIKTQQTKHRDIQTYRVRPTCCSRSTVCMNLIVADLPISDLPIWSKIIEHMCQKKLDAFLGTAKNKDAPPLWPKMLRPQNLKIWDCDPIRPKKATPILFMEKHAPIWRV